MLTQVEQGQRPRLRGLDDQAAVVGDVPGPLRHVRRRVGAGRARRRPAPTGSTSRRCTTEALWSRSAAPSGAARRRSSATSSPSACSACPQVRRPQMFFALTDEQRALAGRRPRPTCADRFDLDSRCAASSRTPTATGIPADLWKAVGEQGWLAVLVPEEHDGLGLGLLDAAGARPRVRRRRRARPVAGDRAGRRGGPAGRLRRAAAELAARHRRRRDRGAVALRAGLLATRRTAPATATGRRAVRHASTWSSTPRSADVLVVAAPSRRSGCTWSTRAARRDDRAARVATTARPGSARSTLDGAPGERLAGLVAARSCSELLDAGRGAGRRPTWSASPARR